IEFPIAAPPTPPTTAPTGPPTKAPATAPPTPPVIAPLSSAKAIWDEAQSKATVERARIILDIETSCNAAKRAAALHQIIANSPNGKSRNLLSATLVGHVHEHSPRDGDAACSALLDRLGFFRQTPAHVFARDVRSIADKICSDGQGNAPCQFF